MNEKASFMDIKNLIPISRNQEKSNLITRSLQLPVNKTQRRLSIRIDTIDPSSFSLSELNNNESNVNYNSINNNFLSVNINNNNNITPIQQNNPLTNPVARRFYMPDLTPILPTIEETSDEKVVHIKKRRNTDYRNDTRIVNESFQDSLTILIKGFSNKVKAEQFVLVDVFHKPASALGIKSNHESFNENFLSKLVQHTKYLLENQSKTDNMFINLIQIFRQMIFHDYYPAENLIIEKLRKSMIRKYFDEYPGEEDLARRKSSLLFNPYLTKITLIDTSLNSQDGLICTNDEDERSERDLKRYKMQCKLNNQGACDLVIDLFTTNISNIIFKENLLLVIALLEGGNSLVQKAIYNLFMNDTDSEKFFSNFHERIESAQREIKNLNHFVTKDLQDSNFFSS